MSDQLPDPPYAADTRAKGWRFEIDHERIRQSDTWALAAPDARPWLLMLWMVAWEQSPCGSMPSEPALIAARIGMQPKAFDKHRAVLMRGWWQASDDRLYHRVVTERVLELIDFREKAATRKAGYRDKMRESFGSPAPVPRDAMPSVPRDSHVGDATGTGTGTKEKRHAPRTGAGEGRFPEFWAAWPATDRRTDRKKCLAKWRDAKLDDKAETLLAHVAAMKQTRKWIEGFEPAPLRYLNGEQWGDGVVVQAQDRFAGAI